MNQIKQIQITLEQSKEFQEWKSNNPSGYFTHAFNVINKHVFDNWQLGYYSKETSKITVFEIAETITISPESEVFQEEKALVRPLNLENIKFELGQAIEKAEELRAESYKQIFPEKTIIILQNIELGQLWNLTIIGKTFDILNIKISSENGEVLHCDLKPLFDFRKTKDVEKEHNGK